MKNIKLFTFGYFLFFTLCTGALFAQSSYNITGNFEGLRMQYDANHENFMQEFEYQYDLVQVGEKVLGTSTIYSSNGDYAEVKIRGMVVGNKFYFEEYEIIDEIKNRYSVWCYKSGELDIVRIDDRIYLKGETKSYQSNYGQECTGGVTELSKTSVETEPCAGDCLEENKSYDDLDLQVSLYPNPTANQASFSFEVLDKAPVVMEVYDLSGRLVSTPLNKRLSKGKYTETIDLTKESNGLFIVKLSIGDYVVSKELVKAAN